MRAARAAILALALSSPAFGAIEIPATRVTHSGELGSRAIAEFDLAAESPSGDPIYLRLWVAVAPSNEVVFANGLVPPPPMQHVHSFEFGKPPAFDELIAHFSMGTRSDYQHGGDFILAMNFDVTTQFNQYAGTSGVSFIFTEDGHPDTGFDDDVILGLGQFLVDTSDRIPNLDRDRFPLFFDLLVGDSWTLSTEPLVLTQDIQLAWHIGEVGNTFRLNDFGQFEDFTHLVQANATPEPSSFLVWSLLGITLCWPCSRLRYSRRSP